MNKTLIPWVKNPDGSQGYTWNPITGCLNRTPEGLCLGGNFPCYAYKLAHGRLRSRYLANRNICNSQLEGLKSGLFLDPFYPRFWPSRIPDDKFHYLGKLKQVKPKGIFVCDMGELFGDWIPEEWQEQIFRVIELNPWHRFYLLTKQSQNLIKFSPFPDNCWVGFTATTDAQYMAGLKGIGEVRAKVKFISFEPLLEEVINQSKHHGFCNLLSYYHINGVIIGAQTKPKKLPEWDWVSEIIEACDKARIPVFLKDNLGLPKLNSDGAMPFYKKDSAGIMVLRQEMPTIH